MTAAQLSYWQLIDCVRWKPGFCVNADCFASSVLPETAENKWLADATTQTIMQVMNFLPRKLG